MVKHGNFTFFDINGELYITVLELLKECKIEEYQDINTPMFSLANNNIIEEKILPGIDKKADVINYNNLEKIEDKRLNLDLIPYKVNYLDIDYVVDYMVDFIENSKDINEPLRNLIRNHLNKHLMLYDYHKNQIYKTESYDSTLTNITNRVRKEILKNERFYEYKNSSKGENYNTNVIFIAKLDKIKLGEIVRNILFKINKEQEMNIERYIYINYNSSKYNKEVLSKIIKYECDVHNENYKIEGYKLEVNKYRPNIVNYIISLPEEQKETFTNLASQAFSEMATNLEDTIKDELHEKSKQIDDPKIMSEQFIKLFFNNLDETQTVILQKILEDKIILNERIKEIHKQYEENFVGLKNMTMQLLNNNKKGSELIYQ